MANLTANQISESKVEVGVTAVLLSAWSASKVYTMVAGDRANTQRLYVGGSAVATASGFGELDAGQVVTIEGPAAVYGIAAGASQNARVIEGRK